MSHLIPLPAPALVDHEPSGGLFRVPLHDALSASRRRHRHLIAAAAQWALARGVSLPADNVALWATAVEELGAAGGPGGASGPWRASHVPLLLHTIAAWCDLAGCSPPADLAESLWHLYGFLAATGRLHPDSDALDELRAAVVVFAGFDRLRPKPIVPPAPTAA